jgi:hypothetical protein
MKLYSLDYLRIAETRSTQEPIFILRQTGEKLLRKRKKIHVCFIRVDLKKVFDRIKRNNEAKKTENKYDSNYPITTLHSHSRHYKGMQRKRKNLTVGTCDTTKITMLVSVSS